MAASKKQNITAEDLYKFEIITGFDISPDGNHIIYSLQKVDEKTEKKHSNLWLVPTRGGKARQFTYGTQVDSAPRWSPDGKLIAFLSNRGDETQSQIYLIPFEGGEASPLTSFKGIIGSFEWSPDSKQFVCMFRKTDEEVLDREKDEQKKKLGIVSRHITRVFYKSNGMGFLPGERWHIWTINARTGKAKQLTHGEKFDETVPAWSPDGKYIAFSSNRTKDPDMDPIMVDLFIISSKGGKPRKIKTQTGPSVMASFSPDGRMLAYCGIDGRGPWWKNMCLWVVPVDGKGETRNLTKKFDIHVMGGVSGDMKGYPETAPPTWSRDSKKIYFNVGRQGNVFLKSLAPDGAGNSIEDIIIDPGVTGSFRFNKDQTILAYFHADYYDPGQIWVRNMNSKKLRRVTSINSKILKTKRLGKVEEIWFRGNRNHEIQGWIVKPPGFSGRRKYPAILEIHGGPHVQYGNNFMHEFQLLAAKGYVVFFSNPRGSQGYGEKFAKAIWNNWGPVAYRDLMSWTDFVCAKPYIDKNRIGVTGGSYGGYMTNWIIGHTKRFKSAVTQRCVSNMISLHGSSDGNWLFQINFGDEAPWENIENYWKQSPLKYIGKAKTPTLVMHSEKDYRTTMDQGEHVFVALKRLKVDTELVLFPDENHDLSRTGRTDRRIQRLNHIIRWFDRYLKK